VPLDTQSIAASLASEVILSFWPEKFNGSKTGFGKFITAKLILPLCKIKAWVKAEDKLTIEQVLKKEPITPGKLQTCP
jgi:hypothetical protein